MNKIKKDYKNCSWKISKSFKEEKEKKWQNGREGYKNLSEDEKNKLGEYKKML